MGSSQTALIILDEISNIQNIKANEIKKILEDANNIRKSSDIEE